MTINSNLDVFCGKAVEDFNPEAGILDYNMRAYRVRLTYDMYDSGTTIESLIRAFASDPKAAEAEDLVIGAFDFESSTTTSGIVSTLCELKDQLRSLRNLFIGDITYEENEISWIQQCDVSPLFSAYPNLVHFQVRGGNDLSLGTLTHDKLETLIVETGGMHPSTITEVCNAKLPNLTKLELWLGSSDYGFDSTVEDLRPILDGKLFPKLKYLGLRDSEISDAIAKSLNGAGVLDLIEELDLSMGTIGDEGAQALLDNPTIRKLKSLNLSHHYLSDAMMEKMETLGIPVDMEDQNEEEEEGYRYVEVAE